MFVDPSFEESYKAKKKGCQPLAAEFQKVTTKYIEYHWIRMKDCESVRLIVRSRTIGVCNASRSRFSSYTKGNSRTRMRRRNLPQRWAWMKCMGCLFCTSYVCPSSDCWLFGVCLGVLLYIYIHWSKEQIHANYTGPQVTEDEQAGSLGKRHEALGIRSRSSILRNHSCTKKPIRHHQTTTAVEPVST